MVGLKPMIGRRTLGGFALGLTAVILSAPGASAHVNWFVDPDATPLPTYGIGDPVFLGWLVLAGLLVTASVWLDDKLPSPPIAGTRTRHDFMELLRVFTGMSFLLTAYEGALLAPHQSAVGPVGTAMLFMQAGIGIMLIANRWIAYAAALMLVLQLGVAMKFGLFAALEYAIYIGIALFLLFNSLEGELQRRLKPYSVDVLRICTGVSLVALAIGEKLAPSSLGQTFVAQYQWNFMQGLGVEAFDDRLFVLSAGMVEAVIGIVLILGTTTRLAILALSVTMAISNVVFILQGNSEAALVEFIGHMPIIGVALVLLLLGYGRRIKVTHAFRSAGTAASGA
ncbi:DoxX family membrane protein [Histidinibacterium aquaticum]|uniref:DoxX family membrane protein n=1 Tax=Histidinibacterium aquaticum TaxID=2613962 RepID=A0A5J5GFC2_9RHOB|nr:DoxX family membrane protein [Histidinibacterium aquaticum]KAA9006747.1 DoxX family membrane protein [Histidinibacterium aquaticum]